MTIYVMVICTLVLHVVNTVCEDLDRLGYGSELGIDEGCQLVQEGGGEGGESEGGDTWSSPLPSMGCLRELDDRARE